MIRRSRNAVRTVGALAEGGQALVEYVLVLALIALVAFGSLTVLGGTIAALLDFLAAVIAAAVPGG